MFRPVTRPCSNCRKMYPHAFLGSRCPSCGLTNWKFQAYVIPLAILAGTIVAASFVLYVLNKL